MNCPHCGKEIENAVELQAMSNLIAANGCNPMPNPTRVDLVFNNAACANPLPIGVPLYNVNGCNSIPQVTLIKF